MKNETHDLIKQKHRNTRRERVRTQKNLERKTKYLGKGHYPIARMISKEQDVSASDNSSKGVYKRVYRGRHSSGMKKYYLGLSNRKFRKSKNLEGDLAMPRKRGLYRKSLDMWWILE